MAATPFFVPHLRAGVLSAVFSLPPRQCRHRHVIRSSR